MGQSKSTQEFILDLLDRKEPLELYLKEIATLANDELSKKQFSSRNVSESVFGFPIQTLLSDFKEEQENSVTTASESKIYVAQGDIEDLF